MVMMPKHLTEKQVNQSLEELKNLEEQTKETEE